MDVNAGFLTCRRKDSAVQCKKEALGTDFEPCQFALSCWWDCKIPFWLTPSVPPLGLKFLHLYRISHVSLYRVAEAVIKRVGHINRCAHVCEIVD